MILFHGLDDRVVPPNQAERIVEALRQKGLPVAYLGFPGEQHGFRRAENVKQSLDAELAFYAAIFGFPVADPIEPLHIENFESNL
jgi:dipeptidyl aminopeptidase/acylaminoacyl peptidase